MDLRARFLKYQRKVGQLGGEEFKVYRPNYSVLNQQGQLITESVTLRAAPQANKVQEPTMSGSSKYNVFGDRENLQSGDVLVPIEPGSGTPILTVDTIAPMKAMTALMTERLGKITKDKNTTVYDNIQFSFLPITFPGSSLEEAFAGSLKVSTRKAVMYIRSGIQRGMRLIEKDETVEYRWVIQDYISLHNLLVLNLTLDDR